MFDIGFAELLLILVMGLVILGPERLPKAAQTLGRWLGNFKGAFSKLQNEVEREIRAKELADKMKDPHFKFDQDDFGMKSWEGNSWESKLQPQDADQEKSSKSDEVQQSETAQKTTEEPPTSKNDGDSKPG